MILPALNEPDLAELAEEIRRDMTFVPVETLEQVVKVALSDNQPHCPTGHTVGPATETARPRSDARRARPA